MKPADALIGRQLGNFRIVRLLGVGGMGRVYYGLDVKLQRPVAIKVIHEHFRQQKDYVERLLSEARAVATWRHKNIAQIYYADDQDGIFYFAMEYINGLNLKEILIDYANAGELMSYEDVALVGWGIADALDYAHERGVIHRDVKPANVLIDHEGGVFLTDFGLAIEVNRHTIDEVHGTTYYIAPEQVDVTPKVYPQSDLYSFGVMLYEMLTGTVPFDGPSSLAIALQHRNNKPQAPRSINPKLTPSIDAVLLKALAKDPKERFQTGRELMEHLARALERAQNAPSQPMALPPIPAGMQSARTRKESDKPLVTRIAEQPILPGTKYKTRPRREARRTRKKTPQPTSGRKAWGAGIAVVSLALLSFALIVGWVFFRSLIFNASARDVPPTPLIASPTEDRAPLPTPTTGLASRLPTASPTARPASTPTPAFVPSPTLIPSPTIPYQDGDLFMLYYDHTSFNMLNQSGGSRDITPIAFERLGIDGQPLERFSGQAWARYNPIIRHDTCMRIEIVSASPKTFPEPCNNIYDAIRTASNEQHPFVFWTVRTDSFEFRVLWGDVEIARCKNGAGTCEIYLPSE